ncbi:fibroblast growth factor-binding protein 1 [Echinops telfairi]|uniref:Fibroblast growth factor-binding protein 1 n=1 Tax=Echinops telfairi TaxID=9371 RepID=A0ABM0IUB5_ECHTE|nr:fibroblast growth factor-binding protein 1 [Echinops telfairi]
MRIQSLALLSCLLLVARELLVEGKKDRGRKKERDGGQRSQPQARLAKGRFVTPDQMQCRWMEVKEDGGAMLKVECRRGENQFGCFFAGNPDSCPEFSNKKRVYWRQIGRSLGKLTSPCEESQTVLKTRLCKKNFPEAHLRMVNSTLIQKKVPEGRPMALPTTTTLPKPTVAIKTKETIPAETQRPAMGPKDPRCEQDPDVQYQRQLIEDYCGESWGSFCKFFLSMIQEKPCL